MKYGNLYRGTKDYMTLRALEGSEAHPGKPLQMQNILLVSHLVAMTFVGIPDKNMTVNHINGNYHDNRPENLEWVTLEDNIKHGFRTGLYDSIQLAVSLISPHGKALSFPSMAAASRWLGHKSQYISGRLARGYQTAKSESGVVYEILPF